jgi:hypothetical protein
LHGVPRVTFDLDILIEATPKIPGVYSKKAAGRTVDLEDVRLLTLDDEL